MSVQMSHPPISASNVGRSVQLALSGASAVVAINLAERSYPITIAPGLLAESATYAALPKAAAALIVTNTTVAPLYADALRTALAP